MADVETPVERRDPNPATPNSGPRFGYMAGWIFLAAFWVWVLYSGLSTGETLSYSDFKDEVAAGRVVSCEVGPNEIRGQLRARGSDEPSEAAFRTIRVEDPDLLAELREAGVEVEGTLPSAWPQLVGWLLPLGLIALFWVYVFRRAASGGLAQTAMSFGKSRARLVAEREVDVSFQDVAGCDDAKAELAEVVEFLKRPEHFARVGNARSVVGRFGMGESVRLLHCAPMPQSGWPQEGDGFAARDCSEQTAARVDEEAEQILDQLYQEAKGLLGEHKDALERVSAALLERESLDEADFRCLLEGSVPKGIDSPSADPNAERTLIQ
jgi:ATP-dependent Zn protease